MAKDTVLIIGGGAAGLAAADILSAEGFPVTILEARGRLGGRIHTIRNPSGEVPIELGAEFVHGARNETWRLIRTAELRTQEVPDTHWESVNGVLVRNPGFWEELGKATENIACDGPDQDFASYLAAQRNVPDRSRWLATEYVEGFHAAPADFMSAHALKRAEARAEKEEATRQFRISHGYVELIRWLSERVMARDASVQVNQTVRIVRWKPGHVEVVAETQDGLQKHDGIAAIVTLPLGVLQAEPEEKVLFDPALTQVKRKAIAGLQMGAVIKVTFEFTERFWPIENFGFIHSHEAMFPVWWSDDRGPILTAWTGAGRAAWLSRESGPAIFAEAVGCLARLFNLEREFIEKRIAGTFHHDWISDRFARGAYSFTPTGMIHAVKELGEPLSDTLFFAGEATDSEGNQGTVQGALSSGERAASELIKTRQWRETANTLNSQ